MNSERKSDFLDGRVTVVVGDITKQDVEPQSSTPRIRHYWVVEVSTAPFIAPEARRFWKSAG